MIRVFPRRTKWTPTDDLAFVGPPGLFLPEDRAQPVYVSCTFTWDVPASERLAKAWRNEFREVRLGGPAFDDPGGEFVPGRFLKTGVTITSRGCPLRCPWCFVPKREGTIRELPIRDGWIVQDSNLLACSEGHVRAVFDMLRRQKRGAVFSGGFEAARFRPWHRQLLNSIRVGEIWFAADTDAAIKDLRHAVRLCAGISREKLRCYVMIGRGETIWNAEGRLLQVYGLGVLPFAQLYRGPDALAYSREWRELARKWSRPAAYRWQPRP